MAFTLDEDEELFPGQVANGPSVSSSLFNSAAQLAAEFAKPTLQQEQAPSEPSTNQFTKPVQVAKADVEAVLLDELVPDIEDAERLGALSSAQPDNQPAAAPEPPPASAATAAAVEVTTVDQQAAELAVTSLDQVAAEPALLSTPNATAAPVSASNHPDSTISISDAADLLTESSSIVLNTATTQPGDTTAASTIPDGSGGVTAADIDSLHATSVSQSTPLTAASLFDSAADASNSINISILEDADKTNAEAANSSSNQASSAKPPPVSARRLSLRQTLSPPRDAIDATLQVATLADVQAQLQQNQSVMAGLEQQLQSLMQKQHQLQVAGKLLEQQKVLDTVPKRLGCSRGRPVAALLLHRCLLKWGCFEQDAGGILDQIIDLLSMATEEDRLAIAGEQGSSSATEQAAYWLAVTSTLLTLVSHHIRHPLLRGTSKVAAPSAAEKLTEFRKQVATSFSTGFNNLGRSLFGPRKQPSNAAQQHLSTITTPPAVSPTAEMVSASAQPASEAPAPVSAQRTVSGTVSEAGDELAPSPAQLSFTSGSSLQAATAFRASLDVVVQKCYGQVRDSFKRQLSSLLPACVQPPSSVKPDTFTLGDEEEITDADKGTEAEQQLEVWRPWCELVAALAHDIQLLQEQCVPRIIIKCLIKQVLTFIDSQLFNQLLLRPEVCAASNAQYLLGGLKRIDKWLISAAPEYLHGLLHELKHVRQAAQFLVCPNKAARTAHELRMMCPELNVQQLYRLCTTFWDDATNADTVSGEVLEDMKNHNVSNNGGLIVTFLVDEEVGHIIAPQGSVLPEVLQLIDDPVLYQGLSTPSELSTEDCPPGIFSFLEQNMPIPAGVQVH